MQFLVSDHKHLYRHRRILGMLVKQNTLQSGAKEYFTDHQTVNTI